jgi:hypothetical protein
VLCSRPCGFLRQSIWRPQHYPTLTKLARVSSSSNTKLQPSNSFNILIGLKLPPWPPFSHRKHGLLPTPLGALILCSGGEVRSSAVINIGSWKRLNTQHPGRIVQPGKLQGLGYFLPLPPSIDHALLEVRHALRYPWFILRLGGAPPTE